MFYVYILIAINFLVAGYVVGKSCFSRGGIEFNHILFFTTGFLVYWIVPILVGVLNLFPDAPAMQLWHSIFDTIAISTLVVYLVICLGCYLCFWAGTVLCANIVSQHIEQYRTTFFDIKLLYFYLAIGGAAAAAYAFALRGELFRGYTTGSVYLVSEVSTRGAFIAVSTFLMALSFVYSLKKNEDVGQNLPFWKTIATPFFCVYFLVAILVSSTGGRLYLVSCVLMLLVYRSVYFQPIKLRDASTVILTVLVITGAVGVARLGSAVTFSDLLFNLASEPLFNSFSLIKFLSDDNLPLLRVPIFLVSDFINLLPSVLFPNKSEWLANPADYGFVAFAPLGAISTFFEFIVNFGVIGAFVFFFFGSFVLRLLKTHKPGLLTQTMYIMLSGWLATTFFRDPFSVSLVKAMLEFSVLTPLLFVLTANIVSASLRDIRFTLKPL